jgi:hypothetical protein
MAVDPRHVYAGTGIRLVLRALGSRTAMQACVVVIAEEEEPVKCEDAQRRLAEIEAKARDEASNRSRDAASRIRFRTIFALFPGGSV